MADFCRTQSHAGCKSMWKSASQSKRSARSMICAMWATGNGVDVQAATDEVGALLHRLDQQCQGLELIGNALLRERADLDRDPVTAIVAQREKRIEAAQACTRIALHEGAERGGAIAYGCIDHEAGAGVDILGGEGGFSALDLVDRIDKPTLGHITAVENMGLVEVDIGVDIAEEDPATVGFILRIARYG